MVVVVVREGGRKEKLERRTKERKSEDKKGQERVVLLCTIDVRFKTDTTCLLNRGFIN